ncbi:hypothetical protein [Lentzea guizhouensis]|uniref:hypothetical protein n=1 Tax=Lentzea guizhouensis TaxID=1586287 RepID=UPI0012B6950B|nr:hypothetical protein [Lentzea guizhouensis]
MGETTTRTRGLLLVYLAVFGGYTGQQLLTPVLPPLARELRLSEFQLGVVMSATAAMMALTSSSGAGAVTCGAAGRCWSARCSAARRRCSRSR